ncbi:hypothetical protein GN956_G21894 [Arapaima gigas]
MFFFKLTRHSATEDVYRRKPLIKTAGTQKRSSKTAFSQTGRESCSSSTVLNLELGCATVEEIQTRES